MGTIEFDKKGININGTYKTLLASSLFYFRIPEQKWNERMQLLKKAGYDTIDVYFPWNYHEINPGIWDFSENRDVKKFLQLAKENALMVIARPGPYICSEWDGGAIPAWLYADDVNVRQNDPVFLEKIGAWYDKILPIIAEFQITNGGTVFCLQIENELDYFPCANPITYMERIKERAEDLGINIPMFYCCGQNDMLRSGGLVPGLITAYNIYSDWNSEGLERRCLHLREAVQERNMPFIVTETNREHSYLKRLLVCGAKLVSPYNQTAGTTMEYNTGISNWGASATEALSLMSADYDFNSMIGAAGEVNKEFYEARLLAALIHEFGEDLATARPIISNDVRIWETSGKLRTTPSLVMKNKSLVIASNIVDQECNQKLEVDNEIINITLPSQKAKLLPIRMQMTDDVTLICTNQEFAYSLHNDKKVYCFYGEGTAEFCIKVVNLNQRYYLEPGEKITISDIVIRYDTTENVAMGSIPGLPEVSGDIEHQYIETNIYNFENELVLPKKADLGMKCPVFMEKLGIYRGTASYEFSLPKKTDVLLKNVSDIIQIYHDDKFDSVFYSEGICQRKTFTEGKWRIETEIWGHDNFDDIRCPALHMGSLKGINGMMQIYGEEDITDGWIYDLDDSEIQEKYMFRYSPYLPYGGIDDYRLAVTPFKCVYDRFVSINKDMDGLFLYIENAEALIYVYVNGKYSGIVEHSDPWFDLSDYLHGDGRIELTLRVIRRFDTQHLKKVKLVYGKLIRKNRIGLVDPINYQSIKSFRSQLPVYFEEGNWYALTPETKTYEYDTRFIWEGKNLEIYVIAGDRFVGRMLDAEDFPKVRGGDVYSIFICKEWLKNPPVFLCRALGKESGLFALKQREYNGLL